MRAHSLNIFSGLLTLGLLPVSLSTQSSAPEDNIIVTASRVEEHAMRLPLAWSTVNSEALTLIDAIHINEIMQRVPGAWISRGNGQEHLTAIRSPVLTGAGGCGAFLMSQDSIPLRASGFCNVNELFESA